MIAVFLAHATGLTSANSSMPTRKNRTSREDCKEKFTPSEGRQSLRSQFPQQTAIKTYGFSMLVILLPFVSSLSCENSVVVFGCSIGSSSVCRSFSGPRPLTEWRRVLYATAGARLALRQLSCKCHDRSLAGVGSAQTPNSSFHRVTLILPLGFAQPQPVTARHTARLQPIEIHAFSRLPRRNICRSRWPFASKRMTGTHGLGTSFS